MVSKFQLHDMGKISDKVIIIIKSFDLYVISYRFIFEFNMREFVDVSEYQEIISFFTLLCCVFQYMTVIGAFNSVIGPIYQPALLYLLLFVYICLPVPKSFYYPSRMWTLRVLFNIATSPLVFVKFKGNQINNGE